MMFKVAFLILTAFTYTECGRILGVFPMAGISHYILASKLMRGLTEAGHDVTMVSPFTMKDPPKNGTYTDVVLDGVAEEFKVQLEEFNLFKSEDNKGFVEKIKRMGKLFIDMANSTLVHPKMKQLVDSKQTFDVIIMEQFMNDAFKVYAHLFGCPLILLSSVGPNPWVNPTVGNPQPVSYVSHPLGGDISKNLSLLNRTKNLLFFILDYVMRQCYLFPSQEAIMHAAYPNTPPIHDLYTNVSLVLLNSHTSIFHAVPLVPNMVEIGGYFIDPPKKLPADLQKYLDNAPDGVIYFSMGSNLKSKDMPEERKRIILNVLGKLKQKVIWKFEEDLPGKPPNVMIKKWCPQQDILAHPNIRLFITHGGLLSTIETIYHGVPILAIPVFGDQPANAARAEQDGYGLNLGYNDPNFTEERFSYLVNELLTNPKYRNIAQQKSKLYHDRTMKPLDTARYWVDYVIRHKGAPHLMVAGVKLPWYKYFMVDVIGSIIVALVLVLYLLKLGFKRLICRFCSARKSKKEKTL